MGTARISPDDRLVAYDWYIHKEDAVELRVASLAPGEPVRSRTVFRAETAAGAYMSAWMPDGRHLLVLRQQPGRTWQIGIVTIENGSYRSLKSLEWRKPNVLSPSPDGRVIAYDVPEGEVGSPLDIFLLAADGRSGSGPAKSGERFIPAVVSGRFAPRIPERPYRKQWLVDGADQRRTAERAGIADQGRRRLD
jgi:hypothetical protein